MIAHNEKTIVCVVKTMIYIDERERERERKIDTGYILEVKHQGQIYQYLHFVSDQSRDEMGRVWRMILSYCTN